MNPLAAAILAELGSAAVHIAKEAYDFAKDKLTSHVKKKLGEAVDKVDAKVLEQLVEAQLKLTFLGWKGVEGFNAEMAAAEARGKAHPLGGDAVAIVECCACVVPDIVLESDGSSRCANCGKPPFTRSVDAAAETETP